MHFEETLTVAVDLAVTLRADQIICASRDELKRNFPELNAA